MENILKLFNMLNNQSNNSSQNQEVPIPKEVLEQYPYGQFPSRYTKSGQENIRIQSENRYSYQESKDNHIENKNEELNISSLLPIIQLMSGKKQSDPMKLIFQLLFKNNKEMEPLLGLFTNQKPQELDKSDTFPNTQKVNISSFRRIDE